MTDPRGIRNNNPGNIRHAAGVTWVGKSPEQTDDAFVQFNTAQYGIRAIARILRSYQKHGLNTVQSIINRWAPPNENNSDAYVAAVCSDCNVHEYDHIDLEQHMLPLIKAIIRHENGQQPYDDYTIQQGIELA